MIRNLFLALAIAAIAASAYAAAPSPDRNVTVIEKNQAFPVLGPIIVNACFTEDCSEIQS